MNRNHEKENGLGDEYSPLLRYVLTVALAFCAFVSGGAVMVYEFLAVRFLQVSFGSILDIWACEIAVCMAGLALGYSLGGYLADRFRSWNVLALVLIAAALAALPMETLAIGIGKWCLSKEYAAWWHPLAAAFSSFLPLLALGTVMPQAVRLHVRRLEHVGAATGWIAAISTTGSIVGVLAYAFVLAPRHGVVETLWSTSQVLAALGGAILAVSALQRLRARKVLTVALLAVFLVCAPAYAAVVFEQYSMYHYILVVDRGDQRTLQFDNSHQSTMSKRDPYSGGFEYTDFFHVPVMFDPSLKSVLFVGLGGGTGPKSFFKDYPGIRIEVAEIDPMVVEVAKEYFALPDDPRLRIVTSDGRTHLRRTGRQYGAIFMDAYGVGRYGTAIPFHLATREFFEIARTRLVNGGCLVYNVMGTYTGQNRQTLSGIHATLADVFEVVYVFQALSSGNTVLVAQKIDVGQLSENGTRDGKGWPEGPWLDHPLGAQELSQLVGILYDRGILAQTGFARRVTQLSPVQVPPPGALILTDNFAPVDITPGLRRSN